MNGTERCCTYVRICYAMSGTETGHADTRNYCMRARGRAIFARGCCRREEEEEEMEEGEEEEKEGEEEEEVGMVMVAMTAEEGRGEGEREEKEGRRSEVIWAVSYTHLRAHETEADL
eukprot:903565-Rhodomonas_salina.1